MQLIGQEGEEGFPIDEPLKDLTMDHWTGLDGLVSNNLTSVFQSSSDFIWVTSFNGIHSFDGLHFTLYDKNNLPFLNSNAFYRTFEDSKGNIWFCSQSSGIVKYSDDEFHQLLPEGKESLSVRSVAETEDGTLWLGTNLEGAYTLKDSIFTKLDIPLFDGGFILDVAVDNDQNVWFATNGNGLVKYWDSQIEVITADKGLNSDTLNKLTIAPDGTLYAGTTNGVFYLNEKDTGSLEMLNGIEINDIVVDDYSGIWFGTEQGLYRYDLVSKAFDEFTEDDGLPNNQVSGLTFDHEQSLWISTKKAGLVRMRDGFFKNIGEEEGLSSKNVNIIIEHDNKHYIGCDDGTISILDNEKVTSLPISYQKFDLGIRDINFSENGDMLIANYRGLLLKSGRSERFIDLTAMGGSNDIRRILRGKDDFIWLATRSKGVIKLDADLNIQEIFNTESGLKADYILALEENENGEIFVGTHSGGMSVIKNDGAIQNYPIEGGKSGILIFNLDIVAENSLWAATNIGLFKFENETFTKIELDKNLNAETFFDIVLIDGFAYLSSNIGLIVINEADVARFMEGQIASVPGRLLDRFDGMASQECTGATRMLLDSQGDIYVPTLGGVSILDPDEVYKNQRKPKVYITDFETDFQDRDINPEQAIDIDPGIVRYSFNFTALSLIAPPKVRIKYKLSGVDKDWIEADSDREVVYTNLAEGNYIFEVIGSNNDGVWNNEGDTISFVVHPYFYETTFFYIFIAICVGLIIWAIFVWRVKNIERVNTELRKLNEELDRFVYSASHDLRAPLSSVLGLVEIARLEPTIEGKEKCLAMINSSVVKLDGFINDIIDYSRNQRIELRTEELNLYEEVEEVFNDLRFQEKHDMISKSVNSNEKRSFSTDGRRLGVVLKNIISNAIRYHDLEKENPYIRVDIRYEEDHAIITIKDNGIGIDKKHLESIFKMFYRADESSKGSGLGLYIVKETMDKLKGEVEVTSEINKGTTFTLRLPSL